MNKKAQGLSITTVVVAILAILVLVVLFYIFTARVGPFSQTAMSCPSGACVDATTCTNKGGQVMPGGYIDIVTAGGPTECNTDTNAKICCSVQ
jgi:hypothetical protein